MRLVSKTSQTFRPSNPRKNWTSGEGRPGVTGPNDRSDQVVSPAPADDSTPASPGTITGSKDKSGGSSGDLDSDRWPTWSAARTQTKAVSPRWTMANSPAARRVGLYPP